MTTPPPACRASAAERRDGVPRGLRLSEKLIWSGYELYLTRIYRRTRQRSSSPSTFLPPAREVTASQESLPGSATLFAAPDVLCGRICRWVCGDRRRGMFGVIG